jgi:alpha-tubulin suppressor-like RCC1 family protein
VISSIKPPPANVASGGTIVVTATVSGAKECTLSANKPVAGLPATLSCEGGNVGSRLVMPANTGKKAAKYKLQLTALASGGGKAKAKATVSVSTGAPRAGTGTAVAAGAFHTCALLSTGHVACWGENAVGQLGDGSSTGPEGSTTPVEAVGITDATQIATGANHTCATLSTGHVDCWGENRFGQLGDGTATGPGECSGHTPCSTKPVEATGITNATQIAAGGQDTCALLSTGHVACWGLNESGQLGDGTATGPETCPVNVPCSTKAVEAVGITDATQIATGANHTCATLPNGHVDCWGENELGQLGDGTATGPEICPPSPFGGTQACATIPAEATGITDATQVAASGFLSPKNHTCALLSTGHVDCWGLNESGQLGDGTRLGPEKCRFGVFPCSTTPVEAVGIIDATQIATGANHTCATLPNGSVDCWGENESAQLGNGTTTQGADLAVPVSGVTSATQIAAGYFHTCALSSTGHVECWGKNESGVLGDGTSAGPELCQIVGGIVPCSKIPVAVLGI